MRLSRLFGRTLREVPSDADTVSHRLLARAGLIDQLAAGLYTMMPLGLRVQRKVERIIREEMVAAGGQEVQMPVLQPLDVWQQSGRDVSMADVLFRLQDRRRREHVLGPTHEEVVTRLVAAFVKSHRDLPVTLFQIHTKHRDEPRPRGGLLRVREFVMKDAYSFDAHEHGMDASYDAMFEAYRRIFSRCGLPVVPVEADSGAIGGKESVEFVLLSEIGEDTVVRCSNLGCGYAANRERAEFRRDVLSIDGPAEVPSVPGPLEEVSTPGVKTIESLATFLSVGQEHTLKAVFYTAETAGHAELVFVAIRGDVEVNEVKLRNLLRCDLLRLATDHEVLAAGIVAGSASPVGLTGVQTVADISVPPMRNAVAGGNRPDVHLRNVNYGRDFTADVVADIGSAKAGDRCMRCDGDLQIDRGIELGHVFKLGTRYAEAFDARYLDAAGDERAIWMGCYGIGVGRTLAAVVEQHHDAKGIAWPATLSPYDVHLVALNVDNPDVRETAAKLYDDLWAAGVEVLFDDRAESAGVKFNDADLLGLPLRVTIGPRGLRQGEAEIKLRVSDTAEAVPLAQVIGTVRSRVTSLVDSVLPSVERRD
jgi:prolyl-tRNA synthetase